MPDFIATIEDDLAAGGTARLDLPADNAIAAAGDLIDCYYEYAASVAVAGGLEAASVTWTFGNGAVRQARVERGSL